MTVGTTDVAVAEGLDLVLSAPVDVSAPTLGRQFAHLLRESHLLKFAVFWILAVLFLVAFGSTIAPYDPTSASPALNQSPNGTHWFGTDSSGFDILSRVISAPRLDVLIAVLATLLGLVLGSFVGIAASYSRGSLSSAVLSVSDTVQAIPGFIVIVILVVIVGPSFATIILVVGIVEIPLYVRLMRSQVLSLRERAFVETARASGNPSWRIAVRHVLPNALAPGLAQASITFGTAILITAGLSFVGAGIRPPTPEWGQMIAAGTQGILIGQWWPVVFPGLAMVVTIFAFAIVGEAMQTIVLRRR